MGTIQTLKNNVGHLQEVLATKNAKIDELTAQVRRVTKERDDAREALKQANSPEQEQPDAA